MSSALARTWLRGMGSRVGRSLAVVLGVAVMGVAVTAAFVGGDLLERLFVADAQAEWGDVDLEARADGNAIHELSTGRLLATEGPPTVAAVAPRLVLRGAVQAGDRALADVQVMGLGAEDDAFEAAPVLGGGGDGHQALMRLDPGEVLVNQRLAERVGAEVGERIEVVVAVPRWLEDVPDRADPVVHDPTTAVLDVRVAGALADAGSADLHRTSNVLLRRDVLARATGLDGRVTVTHLRLTDHSPATAREALDGLSHLAAVFELDIDPVRLDELALAEEDGGLFRSILLFMAGLVAVAAAVAIRGLLLSSAEDRSGEIATLRAMGARAGVVRRLMTAEGAVLGLAGAALGVLGGVPAGRWLTGLLVDHFADLSTGRGREQVALPGELSATPLLLGGLVTVTVVVLAARSAGRRVASTPIAPMLRGGGVAPARREPRQWVRTATIAAGAGLLGLGVAAGGSVLFLGASVLLAQWWLDRRRVSGREGGGAAHEAVASTDRRAALLGLLWASLGAAVLTDPSEGVQAGMGTLILAGMTAIGCGAVLVVPRLQSVASFVRGYLPRGGTQVAVGTAAAVASRERRRSGVTVVTIGAVLFIVAALSVLGSTQALPLSQQGGGVDVVVRSIAPLHGAELEQLAGVDAAVAVPVSDLPQSRYGVGPDDEPPLRVVYPVRMLAASPELAATQDFGLADAMDGVATARDALLRVATSRGHAVVDRAALPEGARVGDAVVVEAGGTERRLRLIAVLDTYLLRGVVANTADMAQVTQLRSPGMAFLRAQDGVEAEALASTVRSELDTPGVTAETMAQIRQDVIAVNRTFTDTFIVMLVLALVVSLGSIAAHVLRSGRERRSELALLGALGLRRRAITLTLAAEPVLAASVGAVVGVTLGLGLLWMLFQVGFGELPFVVRWSHLAALTGGTLAVLAAVCGIAAHVAVPRRLDVALRDLG